MSGAAGGMRMPRGRSGQCAHEPLVLTLAIAGKRVRECEPGDWIRSRAGLRGFNGSGARGRTCAWGAIRRSWASAGLSIQRQADRHERRWGVPGAVVGRVQRSRLWRGAGLVELGGASGVDAGPVGGSISARVCAGPLCRARPRRGRVVGGVLLRQETEGHPLPSALKSRPNRPVPGEPDRCDRVTVHYFGLRGTDDAYELSEDGVGCAAAREIARRWHSVCATSTPDGNVCSPAGGAACARVRGGIWLRKAGVRCTRRGVGPQLSSLSFTSLVARRRTLKRATRSSSGRSTTTARPLAGSRSRA